MLRDKFQWDGYSLQDARGKLLALGNHVSPTETLHVIKEDPDDDRILECAATAKSDFIVSEDKDLLRLGQFGNPGSYRSGISSIWRSRRGKRNDPTSTSDGVPGFSSLGSGGCFFFQALRF